MTNDERTSKLQARGTELLAEREELRKMVELLMKFIDSHPEAIIPITVNKQARSLLDRVGGGV